MVTASKVVQTARTFTRARSRFKSAKLALADVKKKSGVGAESRVTPAHTSTMWTFKVAPKSEAPKATGPQGPQGPQSKVRRPNTSATKNISSTKNTSSLALAVAIVGVGVAGLLVYRYRSQIRSKFLQAKRARTRRPRALAPAPVAAAAEKVSFPAVGERLSPFRLPNGQDSFNSDPSSFRFPEDTFVSGDGFDLQIRAPISQVGEAGPIAHTSI